MNISSTSTVHSDVENLNPGISISEQALNEFSRQIIITQGNKNEIKNVTLFKTRKRTYIMNKLISEQTLLDIIKEHTYNNKQNAIYCNDEIFKIFQNTYINHFTTKLKII